MAEKVGKVLVIGGGIGGMEASLNLVEAGFKVCLVDEKPNIGGTMAQLDKTFPTNDCSMCIMAPKLVEVGRNANIDLFMGTEVVRLEGRPGNFEVVLKRRPRRIIKEKCTSCGLCAPHCPLEVPAEYNEAMSRRSAAYINFPQAIPSTYSIDREVPPCANRCPINLNVRDYVGLIAQGRYLESLDVIREKLPFPGVIGRICNHPCEDQCLRGQKVEQPLAICALKRFVADWEVGKRDIPVPEIAPAKGKKVAVIGGGPSGMACAIEVRKAGYDVTIFEGHDRLGGMLYWGIPAYRLPKDVLERETSVIGKMGVEVRYNTAVGRDISLKEIHGQFDAVYIGIGAQGGRKLGLADEDAQGILSGVDFLRRVARKEDVPLGSRVLVVGGGNVAADVALTARRIGGQEVHIACLESRREMPASPTEVEQMLDEGIVIHNSWGPQAIRVADGALRGIAFKRCTSVFDDRGQFNPSFDENITKEFTVDTIILAIGQSTEPAFLSAVEGLDVLRGGWIKADPVSLQTSVEGIFAGGDAVTGPRLAIDAVAQGREAAESIIRYLDGRDLKQGRAAKETELVVDVPENIERRYRAIIPTLPVERRSGFDEVELALDEMAAKAEAERCLNCRRCLGCRICEDACKPGAINYLQGPEEVRLNVGSVIIAAGFEEFDPAVRPELGYGLYRNVITSTEFERLLSATGPTSSIVMRPSDGRIPKKVAWLQCVGSRDKTNEYCSSVCCMYATKEAIIAKEHQNDIEPTIFYMDVRAFGKGFDQYYQRAKDEHGIRYLKSAISRILEDPDTTDLEITYIDDNGELSTEMFDLVVLSVGMRPSRHLPNLASALGVELNEYGFIKSSPTNPVATSREGIYVSGAAESPKDIPETVIQASGAACEAASVIAEARGKDLVITELPDERDTANEDARIGVFVCNCGVNIGGVVNVPEVTQYARSLPNVVIADDNLFTCSQDTQEKMKKIVSEEKLNRVVVASCSPRTHEFLFRSTIREAGLNKYLFEMANIRDQCSWVHMKDKDGATAKAKTLIRMAVMNANNVKPLKEISVDVNKKALVVGGGLAGMTSALKLAGQNFEVFLLEKDNELGGNLRHIHRTVDGTDVQALRAMLAEQVTSHPLIHVMLEAELKSHSGVKGNFQTGVAYGPGRAEATIEHGIIIVATGGEELKPAGLYGYDGQDSRVMTQMDLEEKIVRGTLPASKRITMIQCVGSRSEERPYCSRICCTNAIKNALRLKEERPERDVVVLYRDIMTYGFLEKYYLQARKAGVRFVRYEKERPPVIAKGSGAINVTCFDPSIMEEVRFETGLLVLSSATIPRENEELANLLKVPRTTEGFFLEAHMKLRPVDFASDGIYLCGLAHSPKNMRESIAQAEGAVARACTILAKDKLMVGGVVAQVDGEKCAACLSCVRVCPYHVPEINEKGEAQIDISKCKGCGNCAAECPAKAIELMHFRDCQIVEKATALIAGGAD